MGMYWPSIRSRDIWTLGTILVICISQLITSTNSASKDEEHAANKVKVSLYLITLSEWTTVKPKFVSAVKTEANKYCSSTPAACELQSWDTSKQFEDSHFNFSTGYPQYVKPFLQIEYALEYPAGVTVTGQNQHFLNKAALEVINVNSRGPLSSSENVEITAVEGTDYGPVPDPVINATISVVFAVIIILLIVIICVLKAKCSKDKRHHHQPSRTSGQNGPPEPKKTVTKNASTPL